MAIMESSAAPDLAAIKARQRATWASGDYSFVGTTLQGVGEALCETLDLHAGERVLDVAAGNGNASLAAARRFGEVTSTDYVEELLERGRARAEAEGLAITFREADAEALPFGFESFDVVVSTFGVMFTPNQELAADELLRVTRRGGRIGLANWTPTGFIGQMFKTIGAYVPPPAGIRSPALWGTAERLAELFGDGARSIVAEPRTFAFRYPSPQAFVDIFRDVYGPVRKTFEALDESARGGLDQALVGLAERMNSATDGTMVVHSEYLEAVIEKR
jgi:SAM-dependent methyltransferase